MGIAPAFQLEYFQGAIGKGDGWTHGDANLLA